MKIHLSSKRCKTLLFLIVCCSIIILSSSVLLSPADSTKPLDMLMLNPETKPVFYITSQIRYNSDEVKNWINTHPRSDMAMQEPSLSQSELNLIVSLSDSNLNYTQFADDIYTLSSYFPEISLSVLPDEAMSDKDYLNQFDILYSTLESTLENTQLASISTIAYPATTSKLSLYNKDSISCIGTVLTNSSDFERLGKIYNYFSGKKSLVVRDEIKLFYGEDIQTAAKEITTSYYLLATKYPAIEAIFSPYVVPNFTSSDTYSLNRNDSDFYLFYTIYSRLLEKPWLSDTTKEVCAISPYRPIKDYDVITDTTELILDPDSDLLHLLETKSDAYAVYFKWNNELLNINLAYPFAVAIEPINETNGISRLSVVVQSKKDMEHETYAIDLNITHSNTIKRAQRIPSSTTLNANGIKADDSYIPILMYHTIEDSVLPEDQNSHVETAVFDSQMKAIVENGYTPINFYDLKNYAEGLVTLPDKPIIITMDDGYLNNYTNAYPIYKKYNIQATLFVSPYYMKEENTQRHFGWLAAQEMELSGLIDIQPHGYDHTPLPYLSSKDAKYHASYAKGLIESHLGTRDVAVLAYPQFRHNRRTVRLLKELGVDFQIINLAQKNSASFNPPKLQRINVPNTMTPEELIATIESFTM